MNTSILLALPHDAAHKSARALVMALGLLPQVVIDDAQAVPAIVAHLVAQPQSVAMIDLASLPKGFTHVLDLAARLPAQLRQRVILLRHEQGPVWEADQLWIKELGFAGLFAEIDAQAMLAAPHELPALVAHLTQTKPLTAQQLTAFFAAMNAKPDPLTLRGMIRANCAMDAESLARAMLGALKSIDRSYHFKTYSSCFLGTEAVAWLRRQFRCSDPVAVQLGQALLDLGLLHHVMHEHGFEAQEFFYRIDATQLSSGVLMGKLLQDLMQAQGIAIEDRNYLGTTYPHCWVGKQAVDWLQTKKKLPRYEAENLLNRAMSFGLIEHVTKEHRVKDGNFFYRFAAGIN